MDLLTDEPCSPGTLVGPWRILKRCDSGTYGTVYRVERASQPGSDCFALKLAHQAYDERFAREAEMLSRIQSPHVPRLLDSGEWVEPDGARFPYLVMDFIEGDLLYEYARRHPLTSREALRLIAQVARALEATHRHGVHRDVKGNNILVRDDGHAFLIDFGCSWYASAEPLTDGVIPPGTPQYRSHQVLRFKRRFRREAAARYAYTPEDDLYALGITAYRLVTGSYPPLGTETESLEEPYRPRRLAPRELATVSPELDALILRMLAEAPQARGTAAELAQELERTAEQAGQGAHRCILPSPSATPTQRTSRPGPKPERKVSLLKALASIAGATALWALWMSLPSRQASPGEPWQRAAREPKALHQQSEERDGGTAEVAEAAVYSSALAAAERYTQSPNPRPTVALDMPDRPLPKQKRPPCKPRSEVLINGGCWVQIMLKAPCGDDGYEWQGSCYLPMHTPDRPNASDK